MSLFLLCFHLVQGSGGGFAAMLDDGILVSQPSPLGKGCPKGADRVTMA